MAGVKGRFVIEDFLSAVEILSQYNSLRRSGNGWNGIGCI